MNTSLRREIAMLTLVLSACGGGGSGNSDGLCGFAGSARVVEVTQTCPSCTVTNVQSVSDSSLRNGADVDIDSASSTVAIRVTKTDEGDFPAGFSPGYYFEASEGGPGVEIVLYRDGNRLPAPTFYVVVDSPPPKYAAVSSEEEFDAVEVRLTTASLDGRAFERILEICADIH